MKLVRGFDEADRYFEVGQRRRGFEAGPLPRLRIRRTPLRRRSVVTSIGSGRVAVALRWVFQVPSKLYERGWGWIMGRYFLALFHVGRRTGRGYITVVEVVHHDRMRDEYIVMAAFGRNCDWYRNTRATPPTAVIVGRREFRPTWREIDETDAAALLRDYERRRWWWGPLLPWLMTKLLGTPYVSTPDSRLDVVRERPMLGFRPLEEEWPG